MQMHKEAFLIGVVKKTEFCRLLMTPLEVSTYSFLLRLLDRILPDEHTWPVRFSYAIGGASGGKAGDSEKKERDQP